jgi:YD repeat-containing protein
VAAPTVTTVDDGRLTVTFAATTDDVGVTGYRLYRDGSTTALTTLPAGATTFTDSGLQPGRTYAYAVSAFDAAGNASAPGPQGSGSTALFTDGFETGNLSRWTTVAGLAAQRRTVFAGTWAAESQSNNNKVSYASKTLPAPVAGVWMRERVQVPKGKLAVTDVLRLRTAAGADLLALYYDANGRLGVRNDTRGTQTGSATVLTQTAWHLVAVHLVVQGATSSVEVFLDGVRLNDISGTDAYGTTPVGQVLAGESTTGRSYDTLIDDVSVDTR